MITLKITNWHKTIPIVLFVIFAQYLSSQTYLLNASSNGSTINTCTGTFYDSGGATGNYSNNTNYVITFCSDSGTEIVLDFTEFNTIDVISEFHIYDGPDVTSPVIPQSPFAGNDLSGEQITASGSCITIRFNSGFFVHTSGWAANIGCTVPCQQVLGSITNITPTPNLISNAVQVCPEELIDFSSTATFPENNTNYTQSIASSTFTWDFGDGQTATGEDVSHSYSDPGIYTVVLSITDAQGCSNITPITQKIHVAPSPTFGGTVALESEICLGSENTLSGFFNSVEVTKDCDTSDDFGAGIPLPDNGTTHSSSLTLDCYNPGETLTDINDIEICANMEHSYTGDLTVSLTCPNGTTIDLIENGSGGTTNLGIPWSTGTSDTQSNNLTPGVGFDYCWSAVSTYSTFGVSAFQNNTTFPIGNGPGTYVDHQYLAGSYQPNGDLNDLLGCPLNGDWEINFVDALGGDNGTLFSWEVNLNPSLLAPTEQFEPAIVSGAWLPDPTITQVNANQITVVPVNVGNQCYTYEVLDDFDCVHDTTVCFNVVAPPDDIVFDLIGTLCETSPAIVLSASPQGGAWSGDVGVGGAFDPGIGQGVYTGTYTVTTPTCVYSEDLNLTVNGPQDASFTVVDFCVGGSNQPIITGIPGGTFSFNPTPIDGATIDQVTGTISNEVLGATYTVEYTTPGICTGSETQNVTITTQDDASFILNDFCEGTVNQATITGIQGGIFSFNPLPADGAIIDPATGSISNEVVGTTYQVEYTTVGDCSNSSTVSVTVLTPDDANFTLSEFCSNSPNSATNIATPGGTFSFIPDPADGASINPLTGEITNGVAGSTYSVAYLTNGTCPNSSVQSVTLIDNPLAVNISENCAIDQQTYTVSFDIINGDPLSYSVSGGGVLTGNSFLSDSIPSGSPYSFDITDGNNCSIITVSGDNLCTCTATASISGTVDFCEGDSGIVNIDFTGDAPWTFVYSIDAVNQSPITTADNPYLLQVFVGGDYTINSVMDSTCNGPTFGLAQVNETALPTATISGNESVCEGEIAELDVVFTGTGPWEYTYAFNDVIQNTITTPNATLTSTLNVSEPGLYTIETVTANGCSQNGAGQGELIVHELPTANINGDFTICEDIPAEMLITLTGTPNFEISYLMDGILQDPIVTDQNQFNLLIENTGEYELVSVSDVHCSGIATGVSTVNIEPLPTASLNGDFTICAGNEQFIPVELTGASEWTITYSIDNILQAPITSTETPFVIPATQEGNYQIENVTDNFCNNIGDGEANIIFFPNLSILDLETPEICIGETALVYAIIEGGVAPYQYTWTSPNLSDSTLNAAWITPMESEDVSITVIDQCNYQETFSLPIVVHQLPPVSVSSITDICGPGHINLENTTPIEYVGDSCMWIIEGDTLYDCVGVDYFFPDTSTYDIQLNIVSPEGCYNELYLPEYIEVKPVAEAAFTYSPLEVTTANPSVNFQTDLQNEVQSYWTFGEEGSSEEQDPIFEFPIVNGGQNFQVCLETLNSSGCIDSTCQIIKVEGEIVLIVPNTFTPDGDGLNELFFPVISGMHEDEYEFRIFNRNGSVVYETTDVKGKWNGVPKNGYEYYSPDGVYNWQIIARTEGSAEKEEFWGSVLMIR